MSDAELLGTHRICTTGSHYPRGMTRRRGQMDPFLTSRQTQWLLVTVVGGSVVSTTVLNPGADSRRAFIDILDGHRAEGWILENEPTYPCVFMRRHGQRRMLTLCQVDPSGGPLPHFSPWRS
jgi:hypothetical protein